MTDKGRKPTTTDAGIPVPSDEFSLTVGPDGPILLQDHYLIEQMANFNRERIPERQPHAKGSGAFGRFEVTKERQSIYQGRGVPAEHQDRHVGAFFQLSLASAAARWSP
jgi:catalase